MTWDYSPKSTACVSAYPGIVVISDCAGALRSLESLVVRGTRQAHPNITLLNRNSPRFENARNRERMKAWRLRNGQGTVDPETGLSTSYMAVRSRLSANHLPAVKLGDEYMESFCSAGRRESSIWALYMID